MEKGQMRAPVYEALEKLKKRRVVPFDVPGHKRGRGNPELVELLGEKCVSLDVNSMKPLDNLRCPHRKKCALRSTSMSSVRTTPKKCFP